MIRKFLLLLVATSLLPHGAIAQSEQTPQNAQLFLDTVAKQYVVSAYVGIDYSYTTIDAMYRLTGAATEGACQTRLEGAVDIFSGQDAAGGFSSGSARFTTGGHQNLSRLDAALQQYSLKGLPYVVDWSKVASVKQTNRHKSVYVTTAGTWPSNNVVQLFTGDTNFAFAFPDEALATRVAFAMEFLRLHCDKTTQTGF